MLSLEIAVSLTVVLMAMINVRDTSMLSLEIAVSLTVVFMAMINVNLIITCEQESIFKVA